MMSIPNSSATSLYGLLYNAYARPDALNVDAGESIGQLFPLPADAKFPPPSGATGNNGNATFERLEQWARYNGNYGLRLAPNVMAIDVDDYTGKNGSSTLHELQMKLGPLPATIMSTRREDPRVSGHWFYAFPGGKLAGQLGADVEIIQHTHRYSVVEPSRVGGMRYQWYAADGSPMGRAPRRSELAPLPPAWVQYLTEGVTASAHVRPAGAAQVSDMAASLADDKAEMCDRMSTLVARWCINVEERTFGSRHDSMAKALWAVSMSAVVDGHHGWNQAIDVLADVWDDVTAPDDRGSEFDTMVDGALAKATSDSPHEVYTPLNGGLHAACDRARAERLKAEVSA